MRPHYVKQHYGNCHSVIEKKRVLPCLQTSTSVLCLLMKSARRVDVRTRCRATSATVSRASTMTVTFSSALVGA